MPPFQCDDVSLDLAKGSPLQGIALLNIPYTHGGSNLWGEHLSGTRRRSKKQKKRQKDLSTSSFNSVDLSVAIQGKRGAPQGSISGRTVIVPFRNTFRFINNRRL